MASAAAAAGQSVKPPVVDVKVDGASKPAAMEAQAAHVNGVAAAALPSSFLNTQLDFSTPPTDAGKALQAAGAGAGAVATTSLPSPLISRNRLAQHIKDEQEFQSKLKARGESFNKLAVAFAAASIVVDTASLAASILNVQSPIAQLNRQLSQLIEESSKEADAFTEKQVEFYGSRMLVNAVGGLVLSQLPIVSKEQLGLVQGSRDPVISPDLPIWKEHKAVRCFIAPELYPEAVLPQFAARCAPVKNYNLAHAKVVYVYGRIFGGALYREAGSLVHYTGAFAQENYNKLAALLQGKEFVADDLSGVSYRLI